MANIITGLRIACSIALLFCPAFSPAFYTLYIIAGVSDMIDGTVARKTPHEIDICKGDRDAVESKMGFL